MRLFSVTFITLIWIELFADSDAVFFNSSLSLVNITLHEGFLDFLRSKSIVILLFLLSFIGFSKSQFLSSKEAAHGSWTPFNASVWIKLILSLAERFFIHFYLLVNLSNSSCLSLSAALLLYLRCNLLFLFHCHLWWRMVDRLWLWCRCLIVFMLHLSPWLRSSLVVRMNSTQVLLNLSTMETGWFCTHVWTHTCLINIPIWVYHLLLVLEIEHFWGRGHRWRQNLRELLPFQRTVLALV